MDRLRRLFLGTIVLLLGACHEHEPFCDGATCQPPTEDAQPPEPRSGGAPASAGGAGGATSYGGAAGEPSVDCESDDDCDDDRACTGQETCDGGVCEPGQAPSCEQGTVCVEQSRAFSCEYPDIGSWLIITSPGAVYGLPSSEIGRRSPLLLAEQKVADGVFSGFSDTYFAPDGSRVWVLFWNDDVFTNSLFEATLGAGLPGKLERVKGLPTRGAFSMPRFSADSRFAYVEDDDSGLYSLVFDPDEPARHETYLLGAAEFEWYSPPAFCTDSSLLLVSGGQLPSEDSEQSPSKTRIFDLATGTRPRPIELGAGEAVISGDASVFLLAGIDRVDLVTCEREPGFTLVSKLDRPSATLRLGREYADIAAGEAREIYSLSNPTAPVLVYACTDCYLSWHEDERFVFVNLAEDGFWLELQGDQAPARHSPVEPEDEDPDLATVADGDSAFLVQGEEATLGKGASDETYEFRLVSREDPSHTEPIVRLGHHRRGRLEWADVDAGVALVTRQEDVQELWLLRFGEAPFTEELVASADAVTLFFSVSPDLTGFAYAWTSDGLPLKPVAFQPFARGTAALSLGVRGFPSFGPGLP
jgi:hypothetical protein